MLPLRFPWLWMALGWLLVAGVCVGSLLPGASMPYIHVEDKLLHAGSYFLLMVWFAGLYEKKRHVFIALVLILLGFALDVLQGSVTRRSFDMLDVAANAAGIVAGLVLSVSLLEGWCQRIERHLFA